MSLSNGQDVKVDIETSAEKSALYSTQTFIDELPYKGNINLQKIGKLYAVGTNQLFHQIADSLIYEGNKLKLNPIEKFQPSFPIEFKQISHQTNMVTTMMINGISANLDFNKEVHNLACTRHFKNNYKLEGVESKYLLEGKYISNQAKSKRTNTAHKHYAVFATVNWSIVEVSSGNVVLEKTTTGAHYVGSLSMNKTEKFVEEASFALTNAILSSMDEFLRDAELNNALKEKTSLQLTEEKSVINISHNVNDISSIQAAKDAVVTISVGNSHGSGFLISNDGYILTNQHVVSNHSNVQISLSNGIKIDGEVVAENTKNDVALVKIDLQNLPYFTINNNTPNEEMVGTDVYAIGTPKFVELGQSISKGIVSGIRSTDPVLIQTDVAVSPGNSGGPLLSNKFEVIGVIKSKIIESGTEGLAFAISIKDALDVLNVNLILQQ